ncbi:MAG: DUF4091 domain-containing protein [Planctomycetota bacterium]|jgi:hypothetical protein
MRAELRDSLEFLYADSEVGDRTGRTSGGATLELDVARGGTIAAHVLLNGLKQGADVRLALREDGRAVGEAEWFRLVDVPVETNTGLLGFTEESMGDDNRPNEHVARRAPFRVYDAMEPVGFAFEATGPTQALRLHLPVAVDAPPGERAFTVEVGAGGESSTLGLKTTVHAAVIPPIGRDTFRVTNWFSLRNMAERHGLEMWSEDHWRMIHRYAKLMAHGRQNVFRFAFGDVFTRTGDGLVLDRERLARLVRTFTEAGMYFIEGGHFAGRKGGWNAERFAVNLDGPLATSVEGNADIARAARQLVEEIEANGWRGRWIQHAADEPAKSNATDYRILCGIIRRHMPGVPILDATMELSLAGALDMWCPQVQEYQRNREVFEAQRELGDEVWYYTLHWGFNHWQVENPFERSVVGNWGGEETNALPPGDTHICYPGPDGPWSSVRLESHREGFEDYELLRRLRAKDPGAVPEVLSRAIRGFDDYVKEVAAFRRARRKLLTGLG